MPDIPASTVGTITLACIIMQFFKENPAANPKSLIVRSAPDIIVDIIGIEKYNEWIANGTKMNIFGIHVIPDPKLEYGTCTCCWEH